MEMLKILCLLIAVLQVATILAVTELAGRKKIRDGYQPKYSNLDSSNPPKGGSGVEFRK